MLITSWYPMNSALHTNEYIYISSHQVHSQASSSLENVSNEHAHTFITSNILGKALRHINPGHSVSFRIVEPSPYFSNITSSFVNEIEIELRDHRGRPLSYPDVSTRPIGRAALYHVSDITCTVVAKRAAGTHFYFRVIRFEKGSARLYLV